MVAYVPQEHGIRVENRSRRIMRQQEALRQQNDNPQQAENRTAGDNSTVSNPSSVRENSTQQNATSILYTPESSTRAQALETTGKRKKGEDDDQASDDDSMPGPSTRRSQPGRTRILFCIKCKSRFASSTTSVADDSENSKTCPSCLAGKPVQKPKKAAAAKKRRIQGSTSVDGGQVPMLQDICIDVNWCLISISGLLTMDFCDRFHVDCCKIHWWRGSFGRNKFPKHGQTCQDHLPQSQIDEPDCQTFPWAACDRLESLWLHK